MRKSSAIILSGGLLAYTLWLTGDGYLPLYVGVAIVSLAGRVLLVVGISWLAVTVLSRVLPRTARGALAANKTPVVLAVTVAGYFIYRMGMDVNRHWLPGRLHPLSLLADLGILLLAVLLAWALVKLKTRDMALYASAAIGTVILSWAVRSVSMSETGAAAPAIEALVTLPYITSVPSDDPRNTAGVTYHDKARSYRGFNLYAANELAKAYLVDMCGNVVHEWAADLDPGHGWHHVELCENGDLLAIIDSRKLVRLDWDSNVRWIRPLRCHHDLDVLENGDISVLARKDRFVAIHGIPVPVRDDFVATLDPEGELRSGYSLGSVLGDAVPVSRALRIYAWQLTNMERSIQYRLRDRFMFEKGFLDLFHMNTLEVIDRDISEILKKDNIIVCSPEIDVVAVIDPRDGRVVWQWGRGILEGPHHPSVLDGGRLLIFDNGTRRKYSRILEVDPSTNEIVWEYAYDPPRDFYTATGGSCQRLPNGNTLITNTNSGHVFEVTREGEIVWEFLTPPQDGREEARPTTYRMERITDLDRYPLLRDLGGCE